MKYKVSSQELMREEEVCVLSTEPVVTWSEISACRSHESDQ